MPSSTSNSKSSAVPYVKLLLAACAVLIAAFETASGHLLKHDSGTYDRVSREYAQAVKVQPANPGEPASVLMVGNSLLLEGVDVDRLKKLTSGQMHIYPIFLEATGYYDWFYGLQRLFREGSRPQVVILGVGVNSFLANSVRQDYAPLLLFDLRDTLGVASDLNMDRTATSNLLLAHSSVFWDTRSVLRTQILRHTVPHYRELVSLLKPQPAIPPALQFQTIASSRLEKLRGLCEKHGAKLIILVPPTPSSEAAVKQMTIASQNAGVDTLVPIDPTALSAKYYQPDELHLNSEGAQLFTSALATFLPKTVGHEPVASPN
jgi:lysophospholipase L1-like esterase